jgi:putative ABC transport system substrate-binding protein
VIHRRDFITLLGGAAAAWPVAGQAQQSTVPVIGYLSAGSLESDAVRLAGFWQGLNETGYVEGRNVAIEYRGMQGHYDLLPAFVADFVRRPVAVIVAQASTPVALAAKSATSTIPIAASTQSEGRLNSCFRSPIRARSFLASFCRSKCRHRVKPMRWQW